MVLSVEFSIAGSILVMRVWLIRLSFLLLLFLALCTLMLLKLIPVLFAFSMAPKLAVPSKGSSCVGLLPWDSSRPDLISASRGTEVDISVFYFWFKLVLASDLFLCPLSAFLIGDFLLNLFVGGSSPLETARTPCFLGCGNCCGKVVRRQSLGDGKAWAFVYANATSYSPVS